MKKNASKAFELIIEKLTTCLELSSFSYSTAKDSKKLKPWMTNSLLAQIDRKNYLFNKSKRHPNNISLRNECIKSKNNLRKNLRQTSENYYMNQFQKFHNNSREQWKLFKELSGEEASGKKLLSLLVDNKVITDDMTLAKELNNYFISVFESAKIRQQARKSIPMKNPCSSESRCDSFYFDPIVPREIINLVNSLRSSSSCGIDGLNSNVLKLITHEIAPILAHACILSFTTGEFPNIFKKAVTISLFKKGDRTKIQNYRPISMLSILSKVLEKLVKHRPLTFLNSGNYFSINQFGFRRNMGTEDA